jgi:hypothetical protein
MSRIVIVILIYHRHKPTDLIITITTHAYRTEMSQSYHGEIWASGSRAPPFLISALEEGEWSNSAPAAFIPWESVPGIHWTEGCMVPKAGLDSVEKSLVPSGNRKPAVQPTALPTEQSRLPYLCGLDQIHCVIFFASSQVK